LRKTTRLKELILAPEILVMPGAFDPTSAKLIERAGFSAVQCSGLAISFTHLGRPDYSFMSMPEMVSRTRVIADATELPVMADADNGFGNAVNAYFAVSEFERAGAAGVNIEDQVAPKRCGHLEGKSIIPIEEAVAKIRAAADARTDSDFVINARTDALAVAGMDEVVRRGNAFLEAGATMVFVDGIKAKDDIKAAVDGIDGPVSVNIVESKTSPRHLTFRDLEGMGVARVSLPGSLLRAAARGMIEMLESVRTHGAVVLPESPVTFDFEDTQQLIGMPEIYRLEERYLGELERPDGDTAERPEGTRGDDS